jgi:hypothetical protein
LSIPSSQDQATSTSTRAGAGAHAGDGMHLGAGAHAGAGAHPGAGTHPGAGACAGDRTHPGAGAHPGAGTCAGDGAHVGAGAWSRCKKISAPFCWRPGCYEPLPHGGRPPYRYCGGECGSAMRRVRERERKRLRHRTLRVVRTRGGTGIVRVDSPTSPAANAAVTAPMRTVSPFTGKRSGVRNSSLDSQKVVSSRLTSDVRSTESTQPHSLEEAPHDRETSSHPRPRPPPAS